MTGRPDVAALRQVAWRAKQARLAGGAKYKEPFVETVDTEEMEEARDDRDRSDIIDSGLDPDDAVLTDGRREMDDWYLSKLGIDPG